MPPITSDPLSQYFNDEVLERLGLSVGHVLSRDVRIQRTIYADRLRTLNSNPYFLVPQPTFLRGVIPLDLLVLHPTNTQAFSAPIDLTFGWDGSTVGRLIWTPDFFAFAPEARYFNLGVEAYGGGLDLQTLSGGYTISSSADVMGGDGELTVLATLRFIEFPGLVY